MDEDTSWNSFANKRQIWRRTRIWARFLPRVNHFSCVEVCGGGAVGISWFKSTMNSITAFSSANSNVKKDSISPPHPVQTSQITFSLNSFANTSERSKWINSKMCNWLTHFGMPSLTPSLICILGRVSALTFKKGCGFTWIYLRIIRHFWRKSPW